MLRFIKSVKALEVAGLVNLVAGCGLSVVGICASDIWTSVTAALMVLNGAILLNLD